MEIGPYIKLHRIQQEMTQAELADGIVSYAYLSKIENQKTEASPNVISLLCTRLGIQFTNETDETIKEKCQEWYAMLFDTNDKEKIKNAYEELNKLIYESQSENLIMFEIHKIRYFLVIDEVDEALKQINKITELSGTFDSLHQFYWYKFKGNYNSITGEFNQAMQMYRAAEEKLNQLDLSEENVADIQYVIAVTHSKLHNTLEAIEYAEKAIDTFRKSYNFIRCAQCHSVLGISYRRIRMYDKSIKNHNLAKHLGELSKNSQIIQSTNHNLGYLHSTKGERKQAIYYYNEVLNGREVDLNTKLLTVTSLIKEYYSISELDKTSEIIAKGFEIFETISEKEAYKIHFLALNAYDLVIRREYAQYEKLVINELIPFLQKQKDFANLAVYARMLGEHFEDLKKYKESVKYYKLANNTYDQLIKL
ncbi:helix-turn-helix domain-containing protein [Virgibacillus siamensis]|uniref:helix-turn-helix domain-containing protein n=1 Tax=Virgibacillus siamensis TaxID=480071 RepID=UPI0009846C89|nr:helix-turn-helix domain-containing protein [Virgibacillus siamensis]